MTNTNAPTTNDQQHINNTMASSTTPESSSSESSSIQWVYDQLHGTLPKEHHEIPLLGIQPAHIAAACNRVDHLVELNQFHCETSYFATPLVFAAAAGAVEATTFLLTKSPSPSILLYAAFCSVVHDHPAVTRLFKGLVDIHECVSSDIYEASALMQDQFDSVAVSELDDDTVQQLCELAQLNLADRSFVPVGPTSTLLTVLTATPHSAFDDLITGPVRDARQDVLLHRVPLPYFAGLAELVCFTKRVEQLTALQLSIVTQQFDKTLKLLQLGADPNIPFTSVFNNCPIGHVLLCHAAVTDKAHEVVEYLLNDPAYDWTKRSDNNVTSLLLSCYVSDKLVWIGKLFGKQRDACTETTDTELTVWSAAIMAKQPQKVWKLLRRLGVPFPPAYRHDVVVRLADFTNVYHRLVQRGFLDHFDNLRVFALYNAFESVEPGWGHDTSVMQLAIQYRNPLLGTWLHLRGQSYATTYEGLTILDVALEQLTPANFVKVFEPLSVRGIRAKPEHIPRQYHHIMEANDWDWELFVRSNL